ncbi:uncharacterized protein BJX67DRAFT_359033 [Aspergillus lucknowensis]|uniref:Uncharacterized protein n=1 Tax=Aspergillus lucknowensis TaxID=176173 RepID=A0ABR4LM67_9EURO
MTRPMAKAGSGTDKPVTALQRSLEKGLPALHSIVHLPPPVWLIFAACWLAELGSHSTESAPSCSRIRPSTLFLAYSVSKWWRPEFKSCRDR